VFAQNLLTNYLLCAIRLTLIHGIVIMILQGKQKKAQLG